MKQEEYINEFFDLYIELIKTGTDLYSHQDINIGNVYMDSSSLISYIKCGKIDNDPYIGFKIFDKSYILQEGISDNAFEICIENMKKTLEKRKSYETNTPNKDSTTKRMQNC